LIESTETLAKHWLEKVHRYHGTSKIALRQKDSTSAWGWYPWGSSAATG
jgi:hypothetical protein